MFTGVTLPTGPMSSEMQVKTLCAVPAQVVRILREA